MTNYYTKMGTFKNFVGKQGFDIGKRILMEDFERLIAIYFGFKNRRTIKNWIGNFQTVKYIKIEKEQESAQWFVTFL